MKLIKLVDNEGRVLYINPSQVSVIMNTDEINQVYIVVDGRSFHYAGKIEEVVNMLCPPEINASEYFAKHIAVSLPKTYTPTALDLTATTGVYPESVLYQHNCSCEMPNCYNCSRNEK